MLESRIDTTSASWWRLAGSSTGKQYVSIAAGSALFVYGLRQKEASL